MPKAQLTLTQYTTTLYLKGIHKMGIKYNTFVVARTTVRHMFVASLSPISTFTPVIVYFWVWNKRHIRMQQVWRVIFIFAFHTGNCYIRYKWCLIQHFRVHNCHDKEHVSRINDKIKDKDKYHTYVIAR